MPSKADDVDTVCCCWCESEPITVSAETNKTGYAPGEIIWVSGMVENKTSRDICSITAKLVQTLTFAGLQDGKFGKLKTKENLKVLAKKKVDMNDLREDQIVTYERKPLLVPPCPPSGLPGCSVINVEYNVEFVVAISGKSRDTTVTLPIIVGTVPLSSAYTSPICPPGTVIMQQPSASPTLSPLPPSYVVATGSVHAIPSKSGHDYTFGKLMYAPRYAFYTFTQPQTDGVPSPPHSDSVKSPPPEEPAAPPPPYEA